jgi:thymidylate kinase
MASAPLCDGPAGAARAERDASMTSPQTRAVADRSASPHAAFLRAFFARLDALGIAWCVVRNFEGLPEQVRGDVDVLVERGRLRRAEAAAEHAVSGSFVARRIARDGHLLLWIASEAELTLAVREGRPARLLELDLVTRLAWRGQVTLDATALLATAEQRQGLRVSEPSQLASHLLCHALLDKGALTPAYRSAIQAVFEARGAAAFAPLGRCAGPDLVARLASAFASGDDARLLALSGALRRRLLTRSAGALPRALRFELARLGRRTRAWLRPPGLLVATAGPDGAGKSTLLARLGLVLGEAFAPVREQYMGWKEFALPTKRWLGALQRRLQRRRVPAAGASSPAAGEAAPRASERAPGWTHNLSLLHYFADLWARYLLFIRPALVRGGVVLCDRYFYDALIQEVFLCRSRALRRLLLALVPRPSLAVLLGGDAAKLAARKGELTALRTQQIQDALAGLATREEVLVLDAFKPLEENAEAVLRRLLPGLRRARH